MIIKYKELLKTYCSQAAVLCEEHNTQDLVGGYSKGGTPLTIPNREVKPLSADGTASSWVGE